MNRATIETERVDFAAAGSATDDAKPETQEEAAAIRARTQGWAFRLPGAYGGETAHPAGGPPRSQTGIAADARGSASV